MKATGTRVRSFTSERLAEIAESLRSSIAHFSLALNPTAPLSIVIKDLDWVASFSNIEEASRVDASRLSNIFFRAEQAERIGILLERVRTVPGSAAVVECVRGNVDRLSTMNERAQDLLFELEIGGRLAARGLPVSFAEPDIRLDWPSVSVGLPCKRPRNVRKIVANIRDGVDQIGRSGMSAGVVIVSIEPILHPPAPTGGLSAEKPRPKNWVASTFEEVDDFARTMVHTELEPILPDVTRLFARHSGLAGVVFCGTITAMAITSRSYAYKWLSFSISSPRDRRSPSLAEMLGCYIRGNEGE
jgi:hypothetical protein